MSSQQVLHDLIRENVKLRDLLPEYAIELDHQGIGRCYFRANHRNGDAHPSLKYDDRHQRLYCNSVRCFDQDGRKGADIFDFIELVENCNYKEALKILSKRPEIRPLLIDAQDCLGEGVGECDVPVRHEYRDESGQLIFTVLRRGTGSGKRIWVEPKGIKPDERTLYRLPDLLQGDDPVVVVEGESCADALSQIGVTATTSPHGAGHWHHRYAELLSNRKVVIWPDKDESGLRYGRAIYQSLKGVASSIRWVEPPDFLSESGDVVDVLEDDTKGGRDTVLDLIDTAVNPSDVSHLEALGADPLGESLVETPNSHDSVVSTNRIELTSLSTAQLVAQSEDISWHIEDILPTRSAMVLVAREGVAKTWMVLDLAIAISQGSTWLNHFPTNRGRVLIIDEENSKNLLTSRVQKLLTARGELEALHSLDIHWLVGQGLNLSDNRFTSALEERLAQIKPDVVVIDSLVRIHRGDENDARTMAELFAIIKQIMGIYECTFVFCHHQGKSAIDTNQSLGRYRGSSEIGAFADSILDVRPTTKRHVFTVTHAKSRFGIPTETFSAEIFDVADGATELRYLDEADRQNTGLRGKVEEFLRNLVDDGEYHSRQEILSVGEKQGYRRDLLDDARKKMIENNELESDRRGRDVVVKVSKRSDVPSL